MNISIRDYMSLISKYKAPIMGLCIAEVLFGHGGIIIYNRFNYFLKLIWVIDIFFFLTGLGVYYSLKKNDDILAFYKRRFVRIYPYYLPMFILYYIGQIIVFGDSMQLFQSLREIAGNVFLLGCVNNLERQFNWYPQAVAMAYLIAPILFLAVRRAEASPGKLLALLGFFIVSQLCFIATNVLVGYSRFIAFVLGIIAADLADRDVKFKLNIPLMLIVCLIGNAICYWVGGLPIEISWPYGLSWYPGLLVIPGMMLVFCWFFKLCDKFGRLNYVTRFFSMLGAYSFEIFLMQRLLYGYIEDFKLPVHGNLMWIIAAIAVAFISIGYSLLIKKLLKAGKRKKAAA